MQARSVNLREHILDVASGLFYKHGVRNVGIDRIIAESGIARMTLYNHFKSKDLLIEEYLRRASSRWMKWYAGKIERASENPRERILAAFSVLDGWFRSRDYRGCSVTNAMVELADDAHPAAAVKDEYHESLRRLFGGLVSDAGVDDSDELVEELIVVLRGAMISALVDGPQGVAARARRTAEHLLDAHLDGKAAAIRRASSA
ncbi:MAG TPA: TetR/AcrR family transcriptional regulator [Thermoanaerobaculia bacterium]|nr:TetR/AcrR family transcriptional regulator [Thermoanaerobaculia bacterium]